METIDPASISDELLVRDDGPEPAQVVPPVVAVVITNDPGPWLEETLRSLAEQDYPALSVLVLDNGSADDPTARIAAAMPKAFVRRRGAEGGFAAAANEAIGVVEGAMFLLFCHDDVALDHDAVRVMVEEAYRSNAAIVGPKVVDAEQPVGRPCGEQQPGGERGLPGIAVAHHTDVPNVFAFVDFHGGFLELKRNGNTSGKTWDTAGCRPWEAPPGRPTG